MRSATHTFGKYQILERIATGGMAEIYKAKLEGIGGFQRTFAIKRILPNLSQNSEYIAMLVDEAKVAGLLSHANIVQILDLGQVDGIWYIAMEYVYGRDLGAVLRRAKQKGLCLPVPHSVFIAIELLKGLEYAHQRQVMRGGRPVALNIIHRDVSPPNILLSFEGEVKLTDFGIARASLKAMETVSGIVKGRFDYMSAEQAAGARDLDQRSDLFTVGVVLYEMLTGTHPFRADNEIGTIERVRTGQYVTVSERNPEVPFALETIVDRALRVNRDERYPTATAFKDGLDKFFHEAGFLFTHATLANYVKGLFPEARSKSPVQPGNGLDARPTEDDELMIDESPVHRSRRSPVPDIRVMEWGASNSDSGDGEPTVLRPNPLGQGGLPPSFSETSVPRAEWEDEAETVLRPRPPWAKDEETVIRKGPVTEELVDEPDPDSDIPTDVHAKAPKVQFRRSGGSYTPDASMSGQTPVAPVARRARIGWLGWAMSMVALGMGLMTGVLVMLLIAWATGLGGIGGLPDPVVRVTAPTGTAVMLDGDAVGHEIRLTPDQRHHLEIVSKEYGSWEREISLPAGATYDIVVVPAVSGGDEGN